MEYVRIKEHTYNQLIDKSGKYIVEVEEGLDESSFILQEIYMVDGKIHRNIEPAIIAYDSPGKIQRLSWYSNDLEHRDEDLPSTIEFHTRSNSKTSKGFPGPRMLEYFCKNGKLHREGKPAVISYYLNGTIINYHYYKYGQRHNENGIASVQFNAFKKFCLNGIEYSEEDYHKQMQTKLYW